MEAGLDTLIASGTVWARPIFTGLTATGLDVTAGQDHRFTDKGSPSLSFYLNLGDRRAVSIDRSEAIDLPTNSLSFLSLDDRAEASEQWRKGQQAATAGLVVDGRLAQYLPDMDAEDFDRFLRRWVDDPGIYRFQPSPTLLALGRALLAEPVEGCWVASLRRQQMTLTFLLEAVRMTDEQEPRAHLLDSGQNAGRLDDVASALAKVGDQAPDILGLARLAGMSVTVLRRRFKARFGETLTDFARRHRLEHALTLLETGTLPIAQVAWHAGYTDTANFTTAFRRHFGVTPGSIHARA